MDLILGRITPRSYCYKATQRFRETFSLAYAGGGTTQEPGGQSHPRTRCEGQKGPGSVRMDGPAVVPPHPRAGMQLGALSWQCACPMHRPRTRDVQNGKVARLGASLAPRPVCVCEGCGQRDSVFKGRTQATTPSLPPLPQLLCSCTSCRGVCQLMHANLCIEIHTNVC